MIDNNIELDTFSSDGTSSVKSTKTIRVKNNCTIKNQIIIEKEKINKRKKKEISFYFRININLFNSNVFRFILFL